MTMHLNIVSWELIAAVGVEDALRWHLDCGLFPPMGAAYDEALLAVQCMADGFPDAVVMTDDDGEPIAFAHHLVSLWDLQPYVTAAQAAQTD